MTRGANRRRRWIRTVFLGDWSAWIRDWADVVRLSYIAGAVYCFVEGITGHGIRLVITFLVALAPRILNTPRPFDLFFTATIGLQAWGNLTGLFQGGNAFDRLDHALSLLGIAPLFYLWFVRLGVLRHTAEHQPRSRHVGIVVIGFCIGMSVGALYEIYEYIAVSQFGARIFINEADTVWDMIMDALGSATGGGLLLAWVLWGWGTERRIAGPPGARIGRRGHTGVA